jgi:hypothetical protein
LEPGGLDDFAGALPPEQLSFEEVLLSSLASFTRSHAATRGALVRQKALQHVERCGERRSDGSVLRLAVPATVLELFTEEPADDPIDVLPEVRPQSDGPCVDARFGLAAEKRLTGVLPTAPVSHPRNRPANLF